MENASRCCRSTIVTIAYFAAFPLARFDSHTLQMERLRDEDHDEAETESGGGNAGNLQNQEIPTFPPPDCYDHGSRSTT